MRLLCNIRYDNMECEYMMRGLLCGLVGLSCLSCLDARACGGRRVPLKNFSHITRDSTLAVKKSNESFEQIKGNITEKSVSQALSDIEDAIDELEKCKEQLRGGDSLTQMQVCAIARKIRLLYDQKFYLTSISRVEEAEKRGYFDENTAKALKCMLSTEETAYAHYALRTKVE